MEINRNTKNYFCRSYSSFWRNIRNRYIQKDGKNS